MSTEKIPDADQSPAVQDSNEKSELDTGLDTVGVEPAASAAAPAANAGNKPKDITKLNVQKSCSRGLAGWLGQHRLSLAITSYQSGRI